MFRSNNLNNSNKLLARKRILRKLYFSRMQITIGLLVVLGVLLTYTLFFSGVFRLHNIRFIPDQLSCASTEKIRALFPRGKNLLFTNTEELSTIVRSKFPCLVQVTMRKQYPDTVVVSAAERKTAVFLKVGIVQPELINLDTPEATDSSQSAKPKVIVDEFKFDDTLFPQTYAVDYEGVLLQENPGFEESIPTIYFESSKHLELNQIIDREIIQNSLGVLNSLRERMIPVTQAKISGDSLYIVGESKFLFSLKKDLNRQVISLQLILQKAKIDSVSVDKVDLRFDKPVVIYSKKK